MPRKKAPPAFVYILGTLTERGPLTYVGWTDDVARRLAQHNAGKGARFTRGRAWVLLHSEPCAGKRHALSREWHIKRDRALRKQLSERLDRDDCGNLPTGPDVAERAAIRNPEIR